MNIIQKYNLEINEDSLEKIKNKVKVFNGWWTINDCRNNQNSIFVFGDNNEKSGKKGQAIIRDESNAFGIPTKRYPSYSNNAYYSDINYDDNINRIDIAIKKILKESDNYDIIYFPEDGLGTGLAKLSTKAPNTYKYLLEYMKDIFGIDQ